MWSALGNGEYSGQFDPAAAPMFGMLTGIIARYGPDA